MAIWSNRKKSSDNSARGGRGSNQYMLQPRSGDYDPDTDINRAQAIRSLNSAGQQSAGNRTSSNNSLKQDIYNLSDAIRDENKSKEIEAEANIRYSAPEFIGSRIVKSVRAESEDYSSFMEEDDEIRELASERGTDRNDLALKTIQLKKGIAKSDGYELSDSDQQDIQDSSEIEARIIKLSEHHSLGDMNDLSDQVHAYSERRIASVGF